MQCPLGILYLNDLQQRSESVAPTINTKKNKVTVQRIMQEIKRHCVTALRTGMLHLLFENRSVKLKSIVTDINYNDGKK